MINVAPDKAFVFFIHLKIIDIFLIFPHKKFNNWCECTFEVPWQGTYYNQYPQHTFSWRNNKNITWIPSYLGL